MSTKDEIEINIDKIQPKTFYYLADLIKKKMSDKKKVRKHRVTLPVRRALGLSRLALMCQDFGWGVGKRRPMPAVVHCLSAAEEEVGRRGRKGPAEEEVRARGAGGIGLGGWVG